MPAFLLKFSIQDYIIAGLAALCITLFLNTYLDLRVGPIGFEGWKPKAERYGHTIAEFDKAQDAAKKLAEAQIKAVEAEYRRKAKESDDDYETTNFRAADAAGRYIAANRMCPSDRGAASPAPATSEDHSAGVPADVPADTLVAVSDVDVQACTIAATIAVEAHNWAVGLSD